MKPRNPRPHEFDYIGRFIDFYRCMVNIDGEHLVLAHVVADNKNLIGCIAKTQEAVLTKTNGLARYQWVGCLKSDSIYPENGEPLYWFYTLGAIESSIVNDLENSPDKIATHQKYHDMFIPKQNINQREKTNE